MSKATMIEALRHEREQLYAELRKLEADARRYRHLRDHCEKEWDYRSYEEVLVRIPCGLDHCDLNHCDDLDAVVDAAMADKACESGRALA